MLLYNNKNGLGRSSQQNASEEGSETPSPMDITLREKVSPFPCVVLGFFYGITFLEGPEWSSGLVNLKSGKHVRKRKNWVKRGGNWTVLSWFCWKSKRRMDVGHTEMREVLRSTSSSCPHPGNSCQHLPTSVNMTKKPPF